MCIHIADIRKWLLLIVAFLILPISGQAQGFSSGSTGADGALDLSSGDRVVQLPESGILNYTTISIPVSRTLRFKSNSRNTPVIMLAEGDVQIAGSIDVSNAYLSYGCCDFDIIIPGPGGFYGGALDKPGFGPGGGTTLDCSSRHAKWVGPLSLVPLVGGSGGAGKYCSDSSSGGGGGGGAILIASSTSITLPSGGAIRAKSYGFNGMGSGGAVRLVANALSISGLVDATSSAIYSGNTVSGNPGVIRLEAPVGSLFFNGTSRPPAVLSEINPFLFATAAPVLTIVSVGGLPVPQYSGARFDTIDLLLPNQLSDPISVIVQARNIPVGTEVELRPLRGSAQATSTSATLNGTFESSNGTATISGLSRTLGSITYLLATASFDPPAMAQVFNPSGRNRVSKVRLEVGLSGRPKIVFLRRNGTVIDQAKLPKKFLEQFGL